MERPRIIKLCRRLIVKEIGTVPTLSKRIAGKKDGPGPSLDCYLKEVALVLIGVVNMTKSEETEAVLGARAAQARGAALRALNAGGFALALRLLGDIGECLGRQRLRCLQGRNARRCFRRQEQKVGRQATLWGEWLGLGAQLAQVLGGVCGSRHDGDCGFEGVVRDN